MTEPLSLLGSGWPGHASPRRTDLARRRSKIVAVTQIEDIISFLFLNTGNNGDQQTGPPGVFAALETAKVLASPLPRGALALAGRIHSLPYVSTPALSWTRIYGSRVRDTPGEGEQLIVELLVSAR
jgi:hypothetical protein